MKHLTIALFLILLLTTFASAQDSVNTTDRQKFNGTWIFNDIKGDAISSDLKKLFKGQTLVISYDEPELKIVKTKTIHGETRSATLLLYTDNRGEKNKPFAFNENFEVTSNTTWENNALVRKYTVNIYYSGKLAGDDKTIETYEISKDGETLTVIEESRSEFTTKSRNEKRKTDESGKSRTIYKRKS